ncbi:PLP-dependent aminotransferase family protein [Roseateles chitinivorans]|uniref:aminotransferase-like domain-containing protein n=1 Tax=Roseateles chitinivorans TaxID=2917965 RepID=UPI003D67885B
MSRVLLYESIAQSLRQQIQLGALAPGERIPSIRQLSRTHAVSTATAVQACLMLEREGLIHARMRSGFFVRAVGPSANAKAPRMRKPRSMQNAELLTLQAVREGPALIPLHDARPAPSLLPEAALSAAVSRRLRNERSTALDYAPAQGHAELRRLIAHRYAEMSVTIDPDEVIITAGTMEAISLALRTLTRAGDVVMVETPTFQGVLQAVAALGLTVVELPRPNGDSFDLKRLEALLSAHQVKAAILVPNFSNPIGRRADDAAKQALLALCARHSTVVIEDDIYGDLAWDNSRPFPLRRWGSDDRVITCGSFSKSLAPGLRVGWLLGGAWTEALIRAKYFSTYGNASLPQLALIDYLGRHQQERHFRRLRRAIAENAERLRDAIFRHWPDGTCSGDPRGGLSLWVQLPAGADGSRLAEVAMAEGIGITPGRHFSSFGDYTDHVRLSCGLPWSPELSRAMRRLGALIRDQQESAART